MDLYIRATLDLGRRVSLSDDSFCPGTKSQGRPTTKEVIGQSTYGAVLQGLESHSEGARALAFSSDAKQLLFKDFCMNVPDLARFGRSRLLHVASCTRVADLLDVYYDEGRDRRTGTTSDRRMHQRG